MFLNYGSMGSVMGHELTHGFDNSGREYDKNGMLSQWWDTKTIDEFDHASECMVNQYSEFTSFGKPLNGKLTLGENIADNGGLRAAYNAYEDWLKKNGDEKPLATINLDIRQLFFISFAQVIFENTSNFDKLIISSFFIFIFRLGAQKILKTRHISHCLSTSIVHQSSAYLAL